MQLTAALDLGHDGGRAVWRTSLELHQLRYLSLSGSMFFASEANQEPRMVAPRLQSLLLDKVEVIPGHLRLLQSLNPSQLTLNDINLESLRTSAVSGTSATSSLAHRTVPNQELGWFRMAYSISFATPIHLSGRSSSQLWS